jgi:Fic family protein
MTVKYIWQKNDWPNFTWDSEVLLPELGKARKAQGQILAQADILNLETRADLIVEEAFATSAIEGELLDRNTIRSSVARRLGLPTAGLPPEKRYVDGLVEMLLDATTHHNKVLTTTRLHGWHAGLFPTQHSGIHKIQVGKWRTGKEPMRVVSGPIGKENIHYEAPPSIRVSKDMKAFLGWWNTPPQNLDGILRAGIAHFWFVSIHPYDDGNGRISRAISDMALSQDEKSTLRLYNLSSQIIKERNSYYDILERSQKGTCEITQWLLWFLKIYVRAIETSEGVIGKAFFISKFWKKHTQIDLNQRQIKVIQKMLEAEPDGFEGGINNRKYVSITGISSETAKRDLADLEQRGMIKRNPGKGRSTSYSIDKSIS